MVVEAKGFKKSIVNTLVQVDQITHADVNLEVGDITQSVQVESVVPLLESDKSTISSVVDSHTISSMPLNARQYLDLGTIGGARYHRLYLRVTDGSGKSKTAG